MENNYKLPAKEITSFTYKLTFGKYKGFTIEEVVYGSQNASYILWAHKNVAFFKLNEDILKKVKSAYIPQNPLNRRYVDEWMADSYGYDNILDEIHSSNHWA